MRRPALPTALPTVLAVCAVVGLLLGFAVAVRAATSSRAPSAGSLVADPAAVTTGSPATTAELPATAAATTAAPTAAAPTTVAPTTAAPTSVAATTVAPTTPAATTAGPTTATAAGSTPPQASGGSGWSCRSGSTRVGIQATMTGTVCARLAGRQWEGSTDLTVTSLGPAIDGTLYLSFLNVPEEPGFDLSNTPIHIPAQGTIRLKKTLRAAVTASQTGGWFEAQVWGNIVPGNASGDEGSLSSPVVRKSGPAEKAADGTASSTPVCARGSIAWPGVTASYSYCTRQSGTRLVGSGSITYRTDDPSTAVFLTVGQAVNTDQKLWPGQTLVSTRVATSSVVLPGSANQVTMALPPLQTELLTGDRSAQAYVFKNTDPDVSPVLALR